MLENLSSYHIKILVLMLCLGIIPTFILSVIIISENLTSNTNQLEDELISSATTFADDTSVWLTENIRHVKDISKDRLIISESNNLVQGIELRDSFMSHFTLESKLADEIEKNPNLLEIIIYGTDGNLIHSTNYMPPDTSFVGEDHFLDALDNDYGLSDIILSEQIIKNKIGEYEQNIPTMFFSAPIFTEIGTIGVVSARVDVSTMPSFSNDEFMYNSVDYYIVNDDGYFVTPPSLFTGFSESQIRPELKLRVVDPDSKSGELVEIIQDFKNDGRTVNLDGYSNYQAKSVIGSIVPIIGSSMYAIVEIDKNEAFFEILQLQIWLYSAIGILFSIIVTISLFFTSNLLEPLKKLKDATKKVSAGNLDVIIDSTGKDEIHDLSKSFKSMIDSLKESRSLQAQAETKYRTLYENSPSLHRTVDVNGVILDCNESYAKRFGYTKSEIIGSSIFDHTDPCNLDIMKSVFTSWKSTASVVEAEIWFQTKDGKKFPGLISVNSLYDKDGKLVGSNTSIQDISDFYKTLEAEEERKNVEQEMQQIKLLNKQKDEFLSIISHELRTPLIPIKGNCEILLDENFQDKLSDEQRKFVKSIISNSKRLDILIDNILLAQKLDLDKYQFLIENIGVNRIINDLFQSYTLLMEQKNIKFVNSIKNDFNVYCDENALYEILTNLINNAMEFIPKENGVIEIGVTEKNDMIEFFVKDNGSGISPEKQSRIFDKFYQLDSSHTRIHGGLGLGLSICQKLVKGMSGTIRVMSQEGKGTTFYFTLKKGEKN
ncbi:MAG: ATP-binding protein [Nitrosopumilus sp.]